MLFQDWPLDSTLNWKAISGSFIEIHFLNQRAIYWLSGVKIADSLSFVHFLSVLLNSEGLSSRVFIVHKLGRFLLVAGFGSLSISELIEIRIYSGALVARVGGGLIPDILQLAVIHRVEFLITSGIQFRS